MKAKIQHENLSFDIEFTPEEVGKIIPFFLRSLLNKKVTIIKTTSFLKNKLIELQNKNDWKKFAINKSYLQDDEISLFIQKIPFFIKKEITLIEILARINLQDEKIQKRVKSKEFQSLVRKTFREWSGAESEEKRKLIRNILSNAAATDMTSDDVIRLFIDWINNYSELHFQVIGAVYNSSGITRGGIWQKLEKQDVREDSAEADLYKLLFRDLSTGGIVRQHRETDYSGNFVTKQPQKRPSKFSGNKIMKSAFDNQEQYELTELGQQFVHYAMTDLPLRIDYKNPMETDV